MKTLDKEIRQLFADARAIDEFKFVLTLINYRGLGTYKLTSNLYEWFEAMEYYIGLYTKETDIKKKVRTGLLLYSTFQENSDFYNIIGSLCNTMLGLQPSSYLYWKTKKYDRFLGVAEKQNFILEKLDECGFNEMVKFFKEQIHTSIRNNYFHSTYALSEAEFILHDSEPVIVAGFSKTSLNINTELMPYIEGVVYFFSVFRDCFFSNFKSYKKDIQVIGYFPKKCDITILGNGAGLQGFRIVGGVEFFGKHHDSGIWYNPDNDWFEGHNIRIDIPSIETIELREQLDRYDKKADINQSDAEFLNLVEKVIERNDPVELSRLVILLLKFGDAKLDKTKKETHPFKQKSYAKYTLPFYQRAYDLMKGKVDTKDLETKIDYLNKLIA